jgi:hypothetical protein
VKLMIKRLTVGGSEKWEWSEMQWSKVKWSVNLWWIVWIIVHLQWRSLYVGCCTVCLVVVVVVVSLLFTLSFALCDVLINCFFMFFNYSLYVCFLVLCVLLAISRVLCFCTVLCIVSPNVYCYLLSVYNCTARCHRAENRQQLINITSNHTQPLVGVRYSQNARTNFLAISEHGVSLLQSA